MLVSPTDGKRIGQIEGVAFTKGVDRKRKLEAEFTARIMADANLWDKYGSLLNDIAVVSTQMSEGTYKRSEFIETVYYGMEWPNWPTDWVEWKEKQRMLLF